MIGCTATIIIFQLFKYKTYQEGNHYQSYEIYILLHKQLLDVFVPYNFRLKGEHNRCHEMLALSIILSQLTFFIGVESTSNQVGIS